MSRAQLHDNSSAVSLFPFLAVLLCTMGSLLLLLVVMTKVARERARVEATQEAAEPAAPAALSWHEQATQVDAHLAKLAGARTEAEARLREEQQRLSHIEDHMRRLHAQIDTLERDAAELEALAEDHHDDRAQAEQEVARLEQLIVETRAEIEALQSEQLGKPRSYAIVPYEGQHGTLRRPLYIECKHDRVLLQPEGIELSRADFQRPLGPGNPLAAALRALREQINREQAGQVDQAAQPYPLILVRPTGISMFYRVREAIESWDAEFGYELVEGAWNLEYPPPNPQMANVAYQAIQHARARQQLLAAAAPRAYSSGGRWGEYAETDEDLNGFGSGPAGDGPYGGRGAEGDDWSSPGDDAEPGQRAQDDQRAGGTGGPAGSGGTGGTGGEAGPNGDDDELTERPFDRADDGDTGTGLEAGSLTPNEMQPANGFSPSDGPSLTAAGGAADQAAPKTDDAAGGSDAGSLTGASQSAAAGMPAGAAGSAGAPPANAAGGLSVNVPAGGAADGAAAGAAKNWSRGGATPGSVPIRRTVQVIVRGDRLAILPDREQATEDPLALTGGREVKMEGATATAINEFMQALESHISGWGMAGDGLYWRPVLKLNVARDGQRRASDLARILKRNGIETRSATTTALGNGTQSNATR